MRKKRPSLSGLLMSFFGFVAGAVLVLLVCMDWYLIKNYQMAQRSRQTAALETAAAGIRTDLDRLNDVAFDYYENNHDFASLALVDTELEMFSYVYELDEALKGRMLLEDGLDGYFLFYGAQRDARYYLSPDRQVSWEEATALKSHIQARLDEGGSNWSWSFVQAGQQRYAVLLVTKQSVSLCLLYDLTAAQTALQAAQTDNAQLYFVTEDGSFARSDEQEPLLEALRTDGGSGAYSAVGRGYAVNARRMGDTGLWLCMQVPTDLSYYLTLPQLLLIFVTFFAVLAVVHLHGRIRTQLIAPLEALVDTMNRIRDGEWEAKIEGVPRFEELQKVNEALEAMVAEIRAQKMLAYEQTIEKQQTQLRFLQLQLKPHFYLNGLKTLNALVLDGERQKMQDLIINLSEHLRYLLQAEREIVPLTAEVAYVKNYAALQKNMTGRPFTVRWELPDGLRDWQVPTLCIQTFVENSFKYAKLGSAQKELVLRISAMELETEEGLFLDICVRDNGSGYDEALLEEINQRPDPENITSDKVGVGIRNLQRRCELHYGERAEYIFYNEDGAVSELILPWTERGNHEDPDRR